MGVKIESAAQAVRRETIELKKPAARPAEVRTEAPQNNTSVNTNRAENNERALNMRARLNARFERPALVAVSMTPQEAEARADEIIKKNGGRGNLDTDAVGRDLAEIARTNPADAKAVADAMFGPEIDQNDRGKIRERDKDEIAQSFARALSDDELAKVGENAAGKELLGKMRDHLLAGRVHRDERLDAARLETAMKGYPTPELTGNPETDIQTIAADLQNIPEDKRDEYMLEVMRSPFGPQALQRAGFLDNDGRDALADGLNRAYGQNPQEVSQTLNRILDMDRGFDISAWSGLADVVSRTGNDELIAGYARHAMQIANSGGDEKKAWAVDAVQALGGMSPEALSNFINFGSATAPRYGSPDRIAQHQQISRDAFFSMLGKAADMLGGPANNVGFANPWSFNPAMGDFLNVVNQMTDASGNLKADALSIFKAVAPLSGDNYLTKEALGKMFVEHGQQITDTFALRRFEDGRNNPDFDPNVLKDFFINVVYSPISDLLEYDGKKLVDVIMGDANGGGVIGDIAQNLMNRAVQPGADVPYIGEEIGSLFGAISGGFLDAVQAYKDKFNDDKEFREFMYGAVNKGLGKLAGKVGIPLDKVGEFVEKLIEAGKKKEYNEKIEGFQDAFTDLVDEMSRALIEFERQNPNAAGLDRSFRESWTEFITRYLAIDRIGN